MEGGTKRMSSTDTRIVQMQFDNAQFESGISQTMRSLDKLEDSLQLNGATKGMQQISDQSKVLEGSMYDVGDSVTSLKVKFSALQVVGFTIMQKLTNYALGFGKRIGDALFGQIISGGKRRSQNIEQAKFQIEGLGESWQNVYEDVDWAVKGTAYGLDEASKVASQLLASGVETGDGMKHILRGVAGVAAMTNSSYDNIGRIFTTVASNGRLMGMQLTQLSSYGLATAAKLAEYYREVKGMSDVTEASVRDMVSKGKVSFEDFAAAMDWCFGKHAKEANATFQGAMSNVNAALSRIGVKFADPVYENLKNIFNAMIPAINAVNVAIDPLAEGWSNITGMLGYNLTLLLKNEDFVKGLQNIVYNIWSYIRPIVYALQKVGILSPNISALGKSFNEITASMQLYGDKALAVENIFIGIFTTLKNVVTIAKAVFTALSPIFNLLWTGFSFIVSLLSVISQIIVKYTPNIKEFVNIALMITKLGIETGLIILVGIISKIVQFAQIAFNKLKEVGTLMFEKLKNIYEGFKIFFEYLKAFDPRAVLVAIGVIALIIFLFVQIKKAINVALAVPKMVGTFNNYVSNMGKALNYAALMGVILSVSALFLTIAYSLGKLANINWDNIVAGAPVLLSALAAVVLIMFWVTRSVNKASQLNKFLNSVMISSMSVVLTNISMLFMSIAATFAIFDRLNFTNVEKTAIILLSCLGVIYTMLYAISELTKNKTWTDIAAVAAFALAIGSIKGLFLTISVTFGVLSLINWDNMGLAIPAMLSVLGMVLALLLVLSGMASRNDLGDAMILGAFAKLIFAMSGIMSTISFALGKLAKYDWSNTALMIPNMVIAIGGIIALMATLSILARQIGGSIKQLATLYAIVPIMYLISGIFIKMAAIFAALSLVPWENIGGTTIAAMAISLGAFAGIMIMLQVMAKKMDKDTAKRMIVLASVVGTVGAFLNTLGTFFIILGKVPWDAMDGALPYIITAGVVITALVGILGIVAAKGKALNLGLIAGIMISLSLVIGAMGMLFLMIGNVNWDAVDPNVISQINNMLIIMGTIVGVLTILTAIPGVGEVALIALGILAAIIGMMAVLVGAIGNAFEQFGMSMMNLTKALMMMSSIDWSVIETIKAGLLSLVTGLTLISLQAGMIGIGVGAMGIALMALAVGLSIFTNMVNPDMILTAGRSLGDFFKMISDVFTNNAEGIALFSVFVLALPVLAGALALAGLSLVISAGSLVAVGFLLGMGGELIVSGLQTLINSLTEIEPMLTANYETLLSAMGGLMIVGLTMTLAGGILLAGSVLLLLSSGIMYASAKLLPTATEALMEVADAMSNGELSNAGLIILKFAGEMVLAGGMLAIGSLLFLAGSGMFLGASTVFKAAATTFNEGMEELQEAVEQALEIGEQLQEAGENVVGGFVEGIESMAGTVSDTMTSIAEDGVIATLCDALEIHSPSEVLRELGLDTLAGYVEGLEEGQDPVDVIMQAISDGVESLGFTNLYDQGVNTMDSLGEGLEFGGGNIMDFMNTLSGDIGESCDAIYRRLNSVVYAGYSAITAMENAGVDPEIIQQWKDKQENAREQLAAYEEGRYDKWDAPGYSGGGSPVSTDTDFDYSSLMKDRDYNGGSGSGGKSSDLASSIASRSGKGTGINDQTLGGTNINSNNVYNFTQNNYSPKELDRTDIYEQTNYQFKRFTGWMQSNA